MVRVITTGGTARMVLARRGSASSEMSEVVAGVLGCVDAGVQELVITVPAVDEGWLEVLEEALVDSPDPLRIWVAVGDDAGDR